MARSNPRSLPSRTFFAKLQRRPAEWVVRDQRLRPVPAPDESGHAERLHHVDPRRLRVRLRLTAGHCDRLGPRHSAHRPVHLSCQLALDGTDYVRHERNDRDDDDQRLRRTQPADEYRDVGLRTRDSGLAPLRLQHSQPAHVRDERRERPLGLHLRLVRAGNGRQEVLERWHAGLPREIL